MSGKGIVTASTSMSSEKYETLKEFVAEKGYKNMSAMLNTAIDNLMNDSGKDSSPIEQRLCQIEKKLDSLSVGTSKMTVANGNRVMVFLDVRNVTNIDRNAKINFSKMLEYITAGRNVMGAFAYDSIRYGSDGIDTSIRFHDYLRNNGFDLKLRDTTNESSQKEVDVALGVDMVQHAYDDNYDIAILISGDRDFVPAIEKVNAKGKKVEVASFESTLSHKLQKIADYVYNLDSMFLIQLMDSETAKRYERPEEVNA